MKKLLLVLLVTSITGAFAAISWSCSSDDMKQSYLPSGCTSTMSGSNSETNHSAVDSTPPPVVTSLAGYNVSALSGLNSSCPPVTGYMIATTNTPEYDAMVGCANNWLSGQTDRRGLTGAGAYCQESSTNWTMQTCAFGVYSDSYYVMPLSSVAKYYNDFYKVTGVNKLPDTGYLCEPSGGRNGSACPAGSYTMSYTYENATGPDGENITGPDGKIMQMRHASGFVIVQ